jgi:hypothetical protein
VSDALTDGFWDDKQAAPQEQPAPQAAPEQPREPEQAPEPAQPAPAAEPAQPDPARPEPGFVPLSALLEERDGKKRERERVAALEAQLAQFQAQQQPVQAPSVYDDPDGYQAYVEQRISAAQQQAIASTSQRFAEKEHGADKVEEAAKWYLEQVVSRDPTAQARFVADPDPFGMVVRQYRQHQLMSQLGDAPDLDQAFEKWAAEKGFVKADPAPAAQAAVPQQPAPQQPAQRPRSIVGAPSAGGPATIPVGPLAGFEALPIRS